MGNEAPAISLFPIPPAPVPALPLTRMAPGFPASFHPTLQNCPNSFICYPCFFLTLKKQNCSQAMSSGMNHGSREVKEGKTTELSVHPFGAEATLLLLLFLLLLFLPVLEALVVPGFSMGASLNKSRLLCELGAWEKPRPREKQTSPAPGLRINTGVLLVTKVELNQSC